MVHRTCESICGFHGLSERRGSYCPLRITKDHLHKMTAELRGAGVYQALSRERD